MNKAVVAIGGSSCCLAFYIAYDYQTRHPMRQMAPYKVSEALIRLQNNLQGPILRLQGGVPLSELQTKYNGKDGNPTYFSADGNIYDVSSSPMFQSSYSQWAGADATVSLARMSLDPTDINRTDYDALTEADLKALNSWTNYFHQKYLIKGRLKEYDNYKR